MQILSSGANLIGSMFDSGGVNQTSDMPLDLSGQGDSAGGSAASLLQSASSELCGGAMGQSQNSIGAQQQGQNEMAQGAQDGNRMQFKAGRDEAEGGEMVQAGLQSGNNEEVAEGQELESKGAGLNQEIQGQQSGNFEMAQNGAQQVQQANNQLGQMNSNGPQLGAMQSTDPMGQSQNSIGAQQQGQNEMAQGAQDGNPMEFKAGRDEAKGGEMVQAGLQSGNNEEVEKGQALEDKGAGLNEEIQGQQSGNFEMAQNGAQQAQQATDQLRDMNNNGPQQLFAAMQ
jgi:hypothetical protein